MSSQHDDLLASMDVTGAVENNMDGHVVTNLGFVKLLDTLKMEVPLPINKSSVLYILYKTSLRRKQSP